MDKNRDDFLNDLFWSNIRQDFATLCLLEDRGQLPPDAKARADAGYQLSFKCDHCPEVHTARGTYQDMAVGVQVLMLRGVTKVWVCDANAALEEALERADTDTMPNYLDQLLNRKP